MNLYKPKYNEYTEEEKFRIKEAAPTDAIVKVYSSLINSQFRRNDWVKLGHNGKYIYKIIRGASVKDLTQDKLWINYDSELELDISNVHDCEIKIAKATFFEQYVLAPWNTPNTVERNLYRVASALAFISIILSIIGIML
jgi:hypothetical protein